jgi:ADP-heptose:LPS heptosyltransferase
MGDVVHTLPSLFLLKRLYPDASIGWVVQNKVADLIKNQPFCSHLWILNDRYLHPRNWSHTFGVIKDMRTVSWDAILDFQGLLKTLPLTLTLRGKKFGFDYDNARIGLTSLFTNYNVRPDYTNIIQKNLALASCSSLRNHAKDVLNPIYQTSSPTIDELKKDFFLHATFSQKKAVDLWLSKNQIKNHIIFSPNTTWESKLWPIEYWKKLLFLTSQTFKKHAIIILGYHFGDQAKILHDYAKNKKLLTYAPPRWNLSATAHLLSHAKLLIAPDTGLLHIADFLGINTIGIFGPTSAKQHGPFLNTKNKERSMQIDCPHVYQKTHGNPGQCMHTLTPEDMLEKIKTIISQ